MKRPAQKDWLKSTLENVIISSEIAPKNKKVKLPSMNCLVTSRKILEILGYTPNIKTLFVEKNIILIGHSDSAEQDEKILSSSLIERSPDLLLTYENLYAGAN